MDPGGKRKTKLFIFGPGPTNRGDLRGINRYLVIYVLFYFVLATYASPAKSCDKNCLSGKCINGSCICDRGWVGDQCQHCQGRFKWVVLNLAPVFNLGPTSDYSPDLSWYSVLGHPEDVWDHFWPSCLPSKSGTSRGPWYSVNKRLCTYM